MNERKCEICQRILPLTPEFFARNGPDKFGYKCKDCKDQWNKEYYATHPRPQAIQEHIGKFLVRYGSKKNIWTVYIKDPWTNCGIFATKEEAIDWIKSR